jgi:hypothetical protein
LLALIWKMRDFKESGGNLTPHFHLNPINREPLCDARCTPTNVCKEQHIMRLKMAIALVFIVLSMAAAQHWRKTDRRYWLIPTRSAARAIR